MLLLFLKAASNAVSSFITELVIGSIFAAVRKRDSIAFFSSSINFDKNGLGGISAAPAAAVETGLAPAAGVAAGGSDGGQVSLFVADTPDAVPGTEDVLVKLGVAGIFKSVVNTVNPSTF